MDALSFLRVASEQQASDLHIVVGIPPTCRINGKLVSIGDINLTSESTESIARSLLTNEQWTVLDQKGEIDISISIPKLNRFRLNVYKQRDSFSLAFRIINNRIRGIEELGLPPVVGRLCNVTRGLILVTGPTGSGKSTTLAAMIDKINSEQECHIITLEEPIEYLHKHKQSIVNQREIGSDSLSFSNALKAALRQDPDVILVGEMRDLDTISIALTAAETGHLVLSSLHTISAAKTIDRIIDVFPPYQQQQIRIQLSLVLQGVISQQLLPSNDKKSRVAATEIMIVNPAIRNIIREGKTHLIPNAIQTGGSLGMKTMDNALSELYRNGLITFTDLNDYSVDKEYINRMFSY